DITAVTAGLERILNDEDAAQSLAQRRGHKSLATALGELQDRQLQTIQNHHLKLPHPTHGNNSDSKGPHPTQTPDGKGPHPTQTPDGNGSGNENGNGTKSQVGDTVGS